MVKLILGMLKGLVLGAGIGYGAYTLGLGGAFHWITYGLVGAVVGLLVGRPLWSLIFDKNATTATGMLKAIFGFGVGVGLYALVAKVWGGFDLSLNGETHLVQDWQPIFGGLFGAIYGGFVELDDSVGDGKSKTAAAAKELPAAAPAPRKAAPKK